MGWSNRQQCSVRFGTIFFPIFLGLLSFLSSCATIGSEKKTNSGTISQKKPSKGVVFKSDEYVVHILKGEETPETLAKRYLGDKKRAWVIDDANEGVSFHRNQAIVIPLKGENKGGLNLDGYQVVPILVYHRFSEYCKSSLCIPADTFRRQMKYLKEKGYRVITLRDLFGFLRYQRPIPKKSVVITIDDGYRSAYRIAYPILKKYGFPATLFIYTDFVSRSKSAMTWNQLRAMKKKGFEVGSHTLSHVDLTKKRKKESDKAYLARVRKELRLSRKIIDRKLKQKTTALSFPYGKYNQRVLPMVEQAGYRMAFSVTGGSNPFFADPLFLKRDQILARDMKRFVAKLKTFRRLSLK